MLALFWVQLMALCSAVLNGHYGMHFSVLPSLSRHGNCSHVFYYVMFDAGSTGTRVHTYAFTHKHPGKNSTVSGGMCDNKHTDVLSSDELPVLIEEKFDSVKPGLPDTPQTAREMVSQLLRAAQRTVPPDEWRRTPVILRATAGFRLLPTSKAHALLQEVRDVFDKSPFHAPTDSVQIMNGINEGVLAWVTVNFLTGQLHSNLQNTSGILDLGGGSTQITFLPKSMKTIDSADPEYIARFHMYNSSYQLYTHSYLGNGIKAARLSALGAVGSEGLKQKVFKSSCLPRKSTEEFSFGGLTYQVSGNTEGKSGYHTCYQEMMKVVKGVIKQPYDLKENISTFYAFSYYFDHAVEAGLIDKVKGGAVKIRDFKRTAKELCNSSSKLNHVNGFLCMDLTYITCLLLDGFGFKDSTVLKLTQKVNNVETSWTLGATINHFYNFKIH